MLAKLVWLTCGRLSSILRVSTYPGVQLSPTSVAREQLCPLPDRRRNGLLQHVLLGAELLLVDSVLGSSVSLWACGVHSFALSGGIPLCECHSCHPFPFLWTSGFAVRGYYE